MYGIIKPSLKERAEKRGLTDIYRAKGIKRAVRRVEVNNILRKNPKVKVPRIKIIKKTPDVIPAQNRKPAVPQRKSVFSAIRNLVKRGSV